MMKRNEKHHMDGFLALLLFGVFAVCILSVLLTGVKVYRGLVSRDQASYEQRTCLQYVATRVRQAPSPDRVGVEPFGGVDALTIREQVDGEVYLTRVYCYDSAIRELYSAEDTQLLPQDGQVILPAQEMFFSLSDGLLTAQITEQNGEQSTLRLAVSHSQEGQQ